MTRSTALTAAVLDALIAFHLTVKLGDRDPAEDFIRVVSRGRLKTVSKTTQRRLQLAEDMARVYGESYVYRLQAELDTVVVPEVTSEAPA